MGGASVLDLVLEIGKDAAVEEGVIRENEVGEEIEIITEEMIGDHIHLQEINMKSPQGGMLSGSQHLVQVDIQLIIVVQLQDTTV